MSPVRPRESADFDEDDRLVWQRGMEEGEAAAVGFEATLQIRPSSDFVHGFVANQLLQNGRGSLPTDAFEAKEAAIEPGTEEVLKVGIEHAEILATGRRFLHMFAQCHENFGAARRGVDAPEEFLSRRFDGGGEPGELERVRRFVVVGGGAEDGGFVRRKLAAEHGVELGACDLGHGLVDGDDFLREGGLRSFSSLRKQMVAQKAHVRTAPLAERAQQIAEESGHDAIIINWLFRAIPWSVRWE